MKIFGRDIGFSKPKAQVVRTEPQAMNTPFLKIGKGNLSLPYVQDYVTGNGVIYFGRENLYPQIINQMYFTSPLHGAIIDFTVNAVIGGGVTITPDKTDPSDVIDAKVFHRRHRINKLSRVLSRDYYMHNRIHLLLRFPDEGGKLLQMKRVDPSQIRYRQDGRYEYSEDWSTNRHRKTLATYDPANPSGWMLLTYEADSPGQDTYPVPQYTSALNWCFLDGEQSYLHKNNIQNSIFPSVVVRRPKRFGSNEEIEKFKSGLMNNKGADGAGKAIVVTGDGMENTPEITSINPNQNDKLFIQTNKSIQDNICFAHKINPSIMGIKVAGSLGNAQELEMSYNIWEKNVVIPLREIMEELGAQLLQIAGVDASFDIEEYRIVDGEIVEVEEPKQEEPKQQIEE